MMFFSLEHKRTDVNPLAAASPETHYRLIHQTRGAVTPLTDAGFTPGPRGTSSFTGAALRQLWVEFMSVYTVRCGPTRPEHLGLSESVVL